MKYDEQIQQSDRDTLCDPNYIFLKNEHTHLGWDLNTLA